MSIKAMNFVRENVDPAMPSGQFFVLLALADHAGNHSGEDWACFPSVDVLAREDTHLSRSAVERHLQTLVEAGWISRKRRVRADGTLGIYDFTIHRSDAVRAALAASRAARLQAGERLRQTLADLDGPHGKTPYGPCGDLGPDHAEICRQPCGDLPSQEPPSEPSDEPSQGAREPGDKGFEELTAVWPQSGLKRTKWPQARASFARWAGEFTVAQLVEAAKACADDPDYASGSYGWPGLNTWLGEERFRYFLGRGAASGPQGLSEDARTRFADDAIRALVVAAAGEGFACAYLDRAHWDAAAHVITPATGIAFDNLRNRVSRVLGNLGVTLRDPKGTA